MVLFSLAKTGIAKGQQADNSLKTNIYHPLMVDFLWEALGEVLLSDVKEKTTDLYQTMNQHVNKAIQDTLGSQVTLLQSMVREKIKRNKIRGIVRFPSQKE